ncbi:MAG TPA: nucleoside hydrolase [Aquimonas sp.]|jgi:purine nucleosidase|nr:nucleoside hydrolase [Xanthomonadales bacterium]HRF54051.1 nucleoside hydrolase [Aquimonas sp.]
MEHTLLIDTDPGVDDALALLMALRAPNARVVGLTIAAGNVGLQHTVANALKLLDVVDQDVPVYPGCAQPLVLPALDAAYVHGRDGFGDTGYTPSSRQASEEHAAIALLRLSHDYAGELTLVMLGPLTNLALALRLDPSLPKRIKRLVIMGAAVNARGNITPSAEFNIAFDPEAAHVVFNAWPCFELVDWEATLAHPIPRPVFDRWLQQGDHVAQFYDAISLQTREFIQGLFGEDFHSADALAMAAVLDPDAVTWAGDYRVDIELGGNLYRGATRVDWQGRDARKANVRIAARIDSAKFASLLKMALAAA